MKKLKDHSLYLVISEEYGNGRGALEIAKSAIKGGVDVIQMREKKKNIMQLVELGKKLSALCKQNRATFIVNDDPMIAKEVDADGVHLGQEDLELFSLEVSRRILGVSKIIGVSTHSLEQFKKAHEQDFDYIAFGPIFETKTKNYFLGTDGVENIARIAKKPVFFIGGIKFSNIDEILRRGAKNIALIRGITEAEDIESASKKFKNNLISNPGMATPGWTFPDWKSGNKDKR